MPASALQANFLPNGQWCFNPLPALAATGGEPELKKSTPAAELTA
jgi:hypothetical protein